MTQLFAKSRDYSLAFVCKKNFAAIVKGTLTLIVVDATVMMSPLLIKLIIDRLSGRAMPVWFPEYFKNLSTLSAIGVLCAVNILLIASVAYGRFWWRVFLIWSSFPWFHEMRSSFFDHLKTLDRDFFKRTKVGDLLSALTSDTENLRQTSAFGVLMAIDSTINFCIFPILLYQLSPRLTFIIVPPLLICSLGGAFLTRKLSPLYEKVQDITGALSGKAFELVSGVRVIKAFRAESILHSDFSSESERLRQASLSVARIQSLFVPSLELALGLAICSAFLIGGTFVIKGSMPLSNWVAFHIYLQQLEWPMMALGWFVQMHRQSKASQKRLQKFAREKSKLNKIESPGLRSMGEEGNEKLFEIEEISYQPQGSRKKIFENLSLQLDSKKWIGLTGGVGSGKTSLLELLSRQRDPENGQIKYNGRDLRELSPQQIREEILYVPQESFLFSRSVRGNLNLGLKNPASDEKLWQLLEDLSFDHGALEQRGGLSTQLGERGTQFSGGQKQRLALGRALSRSRKVYLLDDLFSHVDVETEGKLIQAIRKNLPPAASVILVSQRLTTLAHCEEVIVLKAKEIEFQGTFAEAKEKSSFFLELMKLQMLERDRELSPSEDILLEAEGAPR